MSAASKPARPKGKQTDPATISPQKRAASVKERIDAEIAAITRLSFVKTPAGFVGRDFWAVPRPATTAGIARLAGLSGAYSQKLVAGTRQQCSGLIHACH